MRLGQQQSLAVETAEADSLQHLNGEVLHQWPTGPFWGSRETVGPSHYKSGYWALPSIVSAKPSPQEALNSGSRSQSTHYKASQRSGKASVSRNTYTPNSAHASSQQIHHLSMLPFR